MTFYLHVDIYMYPQRQMHQHRQTDRKTDRQRQRDEKERGGIEGNMNIRLGRYMANCKNDSVLQNRKEPTQVCPLLCTLPTIRGGSPFPHQVKQANHVDLIG